LKSGEGTGYDAFVNCNGKDATTSFLSSEERQGKEEVWQTLGGEKKLARTATKKRENISNSTVTDREGRQKQIQGKAKP